MSELYIAPDGDPRCRWAGGSPGELAYHDAEWGFPVHDDQRLFEKVSLEAFQAGLSWRTILDKRENFRAAFAAFDPLVVSAFTEADVLRLLDDKGIVRHRGKIEAVINNAEQAIVLAAEHGTLADYFWSFQPVDPAHGQGVAVKLAKDLRKRGWRFVGPTTTYAFIQAMGLINDHEPGCVIGARLPG